MKPLEITYMRTLSDHHEKGNKLYKVMFTELPDYLKELWIERAEMCFIDDEIGNAEIEMEAILMPDRSIKDVSFKYFFDDYEEFELTEADSLAASEAFIKYVADTTNYVPDAYDSERDWVLNEHDWKDKRNKIEEISKDLLKQMVYEDEKLQVQNPMGFYYLDEGRCIQSAFLKEGIPKDEHCFQVCLLLSGEETGYGSIRNPIAATFDAAGSKYSDLQCVVDRILTENEKIEPVEAASLDIFTIMKSYEEGDGIREFENSSPKISLEQATKDLDREVARNPLFTEENIFERCESYISTEFESGMPWCKMEITTSKLSFSVAELKNFLGSINPEVLYSVLPDEVKIMCKNKLGDI